LQHLPAAALFLHSFFVHFGHLHALSFVHLLFGSQVFAHSLFAIGHLDLSFEQFALSLAQAFGQVFVVLASAAKTTFDVASANTATSITIINFFTVKTSIKCQLISALFYAFSKGIYLFYQRFVLKTLFLF
jgi:hypothetical protein